MDENAYAVTNLPATDEDYNRILIDNFADVLVDNEFNVITGI